MTTLRLFFAGQIKKVEHRQVGDKSVMELSVCKKNYARQGVEPTFTWINVSVWSPLPDWLVNKAIKGAMIAGSGEFTLRSYKDKDGNKAVSADARCTSYDVEVSGGDADATPAAQDTKTTATGAPKRHVPAPVTDEDPPW